MSSDRMKFAAKAAVAQVLVNPEEHARMIRASSALLAVSSILDSDPIKAMGHMLGSAVEFMLNLGFEKRFIVDFVTQMIDTLGNSDGDKLRDAAKKQHS